METPGGSSHRRFHTVHGANATVQPRCGNQFEIILMKEKAAGNLWNVIELALCKR